MMNMDRSTPFTSSDFLLEGNKYYRPNDKNLTFLVKGSGKNTGNHALFNQAPGCLGIF